MTKQPTSAGYRSTTTGAATQAAATSAGPASRTCCTQGKVTREQIAARAQQIYARRCRTRAPGDAVSDWLEAEAELTASTRQ